MSVHTVKPANPKPRPPSFAFSVNTATYIPLAMQKPSTLDAQATILMPSPLYFQPYGKFDHKAVTFAPGRRFHPFNPFATPFTPGNLHHPFDPKASTFTPNRLYHPFDPEASDFLPSCSVCPTPEGGELATVSAGFEEEIPLDIETINPPEFEEQDALCLDDEEYNNQGYNMKLDPNIHHFNWMGQGVLGKTYTDPAVSLTVILSPARARMADGENLRDSTLLREAMLAIDPIVFHGDLYSVKDLKGDELRNALIGRTNVFYTPFGRWIHDVYDEDDDRPQRDELQLAEYSEGATVINGWAPNGAPTRQEFIDDAEASYASEVRMVKKLQEETRLFGVGSTNLRTASTIDGADCTIVAKTHASADASGLISEKVQFLSDTGTTDAAAENNLEGTQSSPVSAKSVKSFSEIDLNRHFGTSDWADDDDDDIGEAYIASQHQPVSQVTAEEEAEETKLIHCFRPTISGTKKFRFVPVAPVPLIFVPKFGPEKVVTTVEPQSSSLGHSLEACSDAELAAEEEEMFGSPIESNATVVGDSLASPRLSSQSMLSKFPVADATGALQSRSQEDIDEENDAFYGKAIRATEMVNAPKSFTFDIPYRLKPSVITVATPAEKVVALASSACHSKACPECCTVLHTPEAIRILDRNFDPIQSIVSPNTERQRIVSLTFSDKSESFSDSDCETRFVTVNGEKTPLDQFLATEDQELINKRAFIEEDEALKRWMNDPFENSFYGGEENFMDELAGDMPPAPHSEESSIDTCSAADSCTDGFGSIVDDSNVAISPLRPEHGQSPQIQRSIDLDLPQGITFPFSLVSAKLASMLSTEPHKLDGIPEDEEVKFEPASNSSTLSLNNDDTLTMIDDHFTANPEQNLVTPGVDEHEWMASSKRRSVIGTNVSKSRSIKSPCLNDLASLAEPKANWGSRTPQQSLVPLPYKRPSSNAPNTMFGKVVQLSLPGAVENDESNDELVCDTAGVGAIFDKDEEEATDSSSILSAAASLPRKSLYLQNTAASRSFAVLPLTESRSVSGTTLDDVFSVPSADTTPPTTADGSARDGSPAPEVVAQRAKKPAPFAKEISAVPEVQTSRWGTIKHSLRKKAAPSTSAVFGVKQGAIDARRTSSWTKVENRLQKAQPISQPDEDKTGGFRKGVKKVFKVITFGLSLGTPVPTAKTLRTFS